PLTHEELCEALAIRDEDGIEALRRRLGAMVRDGQLVSNRRGGYGTLDKMSLLKGRVVGHPEGFGFVVTGEPQDVFLSSRQMRRVFDGDEVLVRIAGHDHRGRPEGSIVEVLAHNTTQVVGRYFVEGGLYDVRPDNPRISQAIIIPPDNRVGATSVLIVLAAVTRQQSRYNTPKMRSIKHHFEPLA